VALDAGDHGEHDRLVDPNQLLLATNETGRLAATRLDTLLEDVEDVPAVDPPVEPFTRNQGDGEADEHVDALLESLLGEVAVPDELRQLARSDPLVVCLARIRDQALLAEALAADSAADDIEEVAFQTRLNTERHAVGRLAYVAGRRDLDSEWITDLQQPPRSDRP
jgi:hypothetical protein